MVTHARYTALEVPIAGACWVGHGKMVHAGDSAETVRKSMPAIDWATGFYAVGGGALPAMHFTEAGAIQDARKRAERGGMSAVGRVVGRSGCDALVELVKAYEPVDTLEATRAAIEAERITSGIDWEDIQKLLNPLDDKDYQRFVAKLGDHLQRTSGYISKRYIKDMVMSLDFDWDTATEAKLRLLQRRLSDAMRSAAGNVWVQTRGTLYTETENIANGTRTKMVQEHKLSVSGVLSQKDLGAIRHVTASHAHYVTDFYTKQVVPGLSKQARLIVRNGLDRGLGTEDIGKELYRGLGAKLKGRELPYFNVVANAITNRSRTYSALVTMSEAGVTHYIFSAVLDEITTETCRFLDGKVLSVERGLQQFEKVEAAGNPEEVKNLMPWIRESFIKGGKNDGKKGLFIPQADGSRKLMAVVERSGYGNLDDRGKFSKGMNEQQLAANGVGYPPLHGS